MSMAESLHQSNTPPIIIIMGVCGSGKSSVGTALAATLKVPFLDADNYHPESNIRKMSQGIPLTDADRYPWLSSLGEAMRDAAGSSGGVVCGCSALKKAYRKHLNQAIGDDAFYVLLDGTRELLLQRMQARKDHYMPPELLDSQLAILERPEEDEKSLTVCIDQPIDSMVESILSQKTIS